MFLPVLFIPIMTIYSHRHTIDSYSVVRAEPLEVNAFQYVENGLPSTLSGYQEDVGELSISNGLLICDNDLGSDTYCGFDYFFNDLPSYSMDDIFYITCYLDFTQGSEPSPDFSFYIGFCGASVDVTLVDGKNLYYSNFLADDIIDDKAISFYIDGATYLGIKDFQLFNLTTIFGSGNEPTADVFKSYLVSDYYDYGYNTINVGTHNVTYNDTDIGSQFVYDTYNVVDKYFNYDKVFNFGDLYSWLQVTFFSGNAPLGFFIFWHLLIYWLLTSILWLLFDVLIYVPQLVHRWLDKVSIS